MDYNELKISNVKHAAKKKIIIALAVLAVIILAGAAISIGAAVNKSKKEEESNVIKSGYSGLSGDYSFFVVGTDDKKENVDFAVIIRAQLYNSAFTVTPLDITDSQLQQSYKNGGVVEMAETVRQTRNVTIARYVRVTRSDLTMIFGELGHIVLNIDKPITLTVSEGEVQIPAGQQELDYEELSGYLLSLCGNSDLRVFGNTVCEIMKQYIESADYSTGESKFNSIINHTDTDITAADYFSAKDVISSFATTAFTYKTVS